MNQNNHDSNESPTNSPDDTLKQLEQLLAQDVLSVEEDEERLIPAHEKRGLIIRFSVVFLLTLVLFFTGIIQDFIVIVTVVLAFAVLEGLTLYKNVRSRRNKITFKPGN